MVDNTTLQESYNINYPATIILTECFSKACTGYGTYNSDFLYIFKERLEEIIKTEYKNPYNTDSYYPFDIKIFVDVLDPEYRAITPAHEKYDDKIDLTQHLRYVCGKTYVKISHNKNYMVLFIRSILIMAIIDYTRTYHYNENDITFEMCLDYTRAVINHELYHYKQYEYLISTYGNEFTNYIYTNNYSTDYKSRLLELEANKVTHNTLLRYSIYQDIDMQQKQQLIDFKTLFDSYYKEFLDERSTSTLSKNYYIMLYIKAERIVKTSKYALDSLIDYINELLDNNIETKNKIKLTLKKHPYKRSLYFHKYIREFVDQAIEQSLLKRNLHIKMYHHIDDLGRIKDNCGFIGTNEEFILDIINNRR